MIVWISVGIIALFVIGIIYLNSSFKNEPKTREEFLEDLTKFLKGEKKTIEGHENSYRIHFTFDGYHFDYEDFETKGFADNLYKSFLRAKSSTQFSLEFEEKDHRSGFKKISLLSSLGSKQTQGKGSVLMPKGLKQFKAISNNPSLAKKFFENVKIVKIFNSFKNVDTRGKPFSSLKIVRGVVILDFHQSGRYSPKPLHIHSNTELLESHLDKMLTVIKTIDSLDI